VYRCSGVVVHASDAVEQFALLTSIHCINSKSNPVDYSVSFGEKISTKRIMNVKSVILEAGSPPNIPRVAVLGLKLDGPPLTGPFQAIPIRPETKTIRYGHFVLFSGYGAGSDTDNKLGSSLKHRELYYCEPTDARLYPPDLFADLAVFHRDDTKVVESGEQPNIRSDGTRVTSCRGDEGSAAFDVSGKKSWVFALKGPVNYCESPLNYAVDLRFHQKWIDQAIYMANNPVNAGRKIGLPYTRPNFDDRIYDELRSGTSSQEVVPLEPATILDPKQRRDYFFHNVPQNTVIRFFQRKPKPSECILPKTIEPKEAL
jgi:hypothetical protein